MALPATWVEHLFGKLTLRYGEAFLAQYRGLETDSVKADWGDMLGRLDGPSLAYGLDYLPLKPPNAMQFRDICRRAPAPDVPRLAGQEIKPDPARVKAIMARLFETDDDRTPAQRCADNIRRIVAARGGKMSSVQRAQLLAIDRISASGEVMGEFAAIPSDALPPAMREAA
jgi:hypothetical protein